MIGGESLFEDSTRKSLYHEKSSKTAHFFDKNHQTVNWMSSNVCTSTTCPLFSCYCELTVSKVETKGHRLGQQKKIEMVDVQKFKLF